MVLPWDKNWEKLYNALGMGDFMDFISSPALQDKLLLIKVVFVLFTAFFFCAVIYFYMNSSYLRYQFGQDFAEFFSWQAYGLRDVNRRWKRIARKIETESEKNYKLAIVEADDLLRQILEDAEFEGDTFEKLVDSAGERVLPNWQDILKAHHVRNLIVHDVNYKLDSNLAKKILEDYEKAAKGAYSY